MLMMIRSKDSKLDALSLKGVPKLLKFKNGLCKTFVTPAVAGKIIKELKKSKDFEIVFMPEGVELE
jgi:hypothetical protein